MKRVITLIYDNILFHNTEMLRKIDGKEGFVIQRLPEDVRQKLRAPAQERYLCPAGVELRFVSEGDVIKINLHNYGAQDTVDIYMGDYQWKEILVNEGPCEIVIQIPKFIRLALENVNEFQFSPNVVRIMFLGIFSKIHYVGIEGIGIRPPLKTEMPRKRCICYGTSITHGAFATSPVLTFIAQTAWRLGVDAINLGIGGCAFCESALGEYIAKRDDWDFATICVSTNMLTLGVSADEFYITAKAFIEKIASNNISKPIFCISIFPFFEDVNISREDMKLVSTPNEYREVLRKIVSEISHPKIYYIDGRELLTEFSGLSCDLLHPGNLGMIRMGENLAKFISDKI